MLGDFINAVADGLFEKGFGDEGEEVYWEMKTCFGSKVREFVAEMSTMSRNICKGDWKR